MLLRDIDALYLIHSFAIQRKADTSLNPSERHRRALLRYEVEPFACTQYLNLCNSELERNNTNNATVKLKSALVDVEYIGEVKLGTPPQSFMMNFDTGSADTWIPAVGCNNCGNHTFFQPANSSTFTNASDNAEQWTIKYGDGSVVQGTTAYETITIGNVTLNNHSIGMTTIESAEFAEDPAMDGIFGLGFPSLSFIRADNRSVVQTMRDQGIIDKAVMGIYLGDPHNAGDGEITFGDTNPQHYTGDIQYMPITSEKYWEVPFNGVRIGNSTVTSQGANGQPAANKAIVDTGTTLIIVPPSLSRVIHEAVPGAVYNESTGWRVPCAVAATAAASDGDDENIASSGATATATNTSSGTPANVTFLLGDHQFPVPVEELVRQRQTIENKTMCYSGVSEMQSPMIIMGDMFLRHYYSVYDYDQKRIGFAPVAH